MIPVITTFEEEEHKWVLQKGRSQNKDAASNVVRTLRNLARNEEFSLTSAKWPEMHNFDLDGPVVKTHESAQRAIVGTQWVDEVRRNAEPTSVTEALYKMAGKPLSVHSHESKEGPTLTSIFVDTGVKMAVHHLPISDKLGVVLYGTVKEEADQGFVKATAHSIADLVLDMVIEGFGEGMVECGIDTAMLAPLVPKHSVVPWVIGAHATRVAADVAEKVLPAYEDDPIRDSFAFDSNYTTVDTRIFLGLVSIPSQVLESAHHVAADVLLEGLHAAGVTDEQIHAAAEKLQATAMRVGSVANLHDTGFGH